jgi:hypothetical protein
VTSIESQLAKLHEDMARLETPSAVVWRACDLRTFVDALFTQIVTSLSPAAAAAVVGSALRDLVGWGQSVKRARDRAASLHEALVAESPELPHVAVLARLRASLEESYRQRTPSARALEFASKLLGLLVRHDGGRTADRIWAVRGRLRDDIERDDLPELGALRAAIDEALRQPRLAEAIVDTRVIPALLEYASRHRFLQHRAMFEAVARPVFVEPPQPTPAIPPVETNIPEPRPRAPRRPRRQVACSPVPAVPADGAPDPAPQPIDPSRLYTTAEAGEILRYKGPGAIRKAVHDGRLTPFGRRGGRKTLLFLGAELLRFARNDPQPTIATLRVASP